jgi:hypothetical protein
MATVSFTEFLPEVLPHVPGCADVVAVNAIRNACIEFCTNSLYWQETRDVERYSNSDFPSFLQAPTGARVTSILSVKFNGQPLDPTTEDALDAKYLNWQATTGTAPAKYYQPNSDAFSVFPLPSVSFDLVLRVAYTPIRAGTGVDSAVYQDYLEEISAGAITRLMATPAQPYSNPTAALTYNVVFQKAISSAAIIAAKSFSRAVDRVELRGAA